MSPISTLALSCLGFATIAAAHPALRGAPLESRLFLNANMDRAAADLENPEAYFSAALRDLKELRMAGTREALFGLEGHYVGRTIDWRAWDERIARIEAAGLKLVIELMPQSFVRNDDDHGPQWEANLRSWVHDVVFHYGTRAIWYSLDNEPDFRARGSWSNQPANLVRMQQIAYEALKQANPRARLETSPLGVPCGQNFSARELFELGITRYCDFFGFHAHFALDDPGARYALPTVWEAMKAGVAKGYPARPVVNTETGSYWARFRGVGENGLTEEQQHQWRAWYMGQNLVMQKSYGVSYLVAYAWANSRPRDGQYNLVDMHNGFRRWQPEFDAVKELWHPDAHAFARGINGGFEEPNPDESRGWAVSFALLQNEKSTTPSFPPKEWDRVQLRFDEASARSGRGCLEMLPGGPNRVRRLVEGLTGNVPHRLTAYVKASGAGAEATLSAMGFNPLDGLEKPAQAATASQNGWQKLSVEFTSTNPWVVIVLEHSGDGTVWWDDVELEELGI